MTISVIDVILSMPIESPPAHRGSALAHWAIALALFSIQLVREPTLFSLFLNSEKCVSGCNINPFGKQQEELK